MRTSRTLSQKEHDCGVLVETHSSSQQPLYKIVTLKSKKIMICRQMLNTFTQLLTEAKESAETWKERSRMMERSRDYWYERARDLEKKLYCHTCLNRHKEVKELNDGETMELCVECTERVT